VDDWLKFKVHDSSDDSQKISDKNRVNAILIDEVRKELDNVMLKRIIYNGHGSLTGNECDEDESERVINVIKTLLTSGK
jgi:radical SAM superfamily enzyme with C-terminal helix-hairpin-helix motif